MTRPNNRSANIGSSGYCWNKTYARRPISLQCGKPFKKSKEFCREHGISRWVARNMLLKHIIAGSRFSGVWYYQILDQDCFDDYLRRNSGKHVQRHGNTVYQ